MLLKTTLSLMFLALPAWATPRVYTYECRYLKSHNSSFEKFVLKVSGPRARIEAAGNKYQGTLDRDYNPRANLNFFRYENWNGLDSEWHAWVLIEKSLLKGGREVRDGDLGGYVKIQARGESYDSQTYGCLRTM